ncbi:MULTISPECIES: nicotinate phosphoribosyltransferase [Paenibacillus]|nr:MULTISPECIES: nicotinate phosphoribosyltransferase [Paenibacillus]AIQ74868.1 nicotinate phosphoribosyltransferase [Paenibacillus odorifer]ETT46332.1 nicotinate phosphoribosyltransferase [Paenibacillus sp. FSL H8-237]MEC0133418.1 nicotinate phosphoribosyltransferase [Paenibacillus odorifer]MEC0221302.1 nicotinate phosphoribosyltransferase [Paenibacillus odorifer]OZQ66701.1 nicotinate phosphoribosyltransferase [Paenibacillus odorifer]
MKRELALHTDKYQINMMYAHWVNGSHKRKAVFEAYFRKLPFGNGYAVFAGLERIVGYIGGLRFTEDDIRYLSEQEENYAPAFLEELLQFHFQGNVYSMKEGALIFPDEPLIRVEGTIMEAQLVETAILNFMNYQTLIATKASRIKQVAPNDILLEFGTRRAQEADAAVWGARAAYIGGFDATSNMLAGKMFGIPTKGTHAHSWVQSFSSEQEAFDAYAKVMPDEVTLLVDTFDTLRSGVPNAIRTAKKLEAQGKKMIGIRLDSGDLAYLSRQARNMLDEAGLDYVKIVASNDLDENTIMDLKLQGAAIDTWGVGTQLITASDQPSLGGVYKLVEIESATGEMVPTIKISSNPEKVSTPGSKDVFRIIGKNGKALADYICFPEEEAPRNGGRVKLFNPLHPYMHKYVERYEALPMLEPIYVNGFQVYTLPDLNEVRRYHREQKDLFWPEYLRKLNPEVYRVNLSEKVWTNKQQLIAEHIQPEIE